MEGTIFKKLIGALVGLAMMGMAGTANALLIVDGGSGQLLGATDILVDGTPYDVTFVDGRCFDLFNECDEPADFDFTDETTALLAAQALLDQVFIDGGSGLFDTEPELTQGCVSLVECITIIPFLSLGTNDGTFLLAFTDNDTDELIDFAGSGGTSILADFASGAGGFGDNANFARFTAVPEPSTLLLFGVGLVGLAATRRRQGHHPSKK